MRLPRNPLHLHTDGGEVNDVERFVQSYGKHAAGNPWSDLADDDGEPMERWTLTPRSVALYGVIDHFYVGIHRHRTGVCVAAKIRTDGRWHWVWVGTNAVIQERSNDRPGCNDTTCSRCPAGRALVLGD